MSCKSKKKLQASELGMAMRQEQGLEAEKQSFHIKLWPCSRGFTGADNCAFLILAVMSHDCCSNGRAFNPCIFQFSHKKSPPSETVCR